MMAYTSSDSINDPIAIIGMSCKFAGDATNIEKFWRLLVEEKCVWSEIPSSRFHWKGNYNPNHEKRSTVCSNFN